jgi:hypothetical protein
MADFCHASTTRKPEGRDYLDWLGNAWASQRDEASRPSLVRSPPVGGNGDRLNRSGPAYLAGSVGGVGGVLGVSGFFSPHPQTTAKTAVRHNVANNFLIA